MESFTAKEMDASRTDQGLEFERKEMSRSFANPQRMYWSSTYDFTILLEFKQELDFLLGILRSENCFMWNYGFT
jgi:hypothetical protein